MTKSGTVFVILILSGFSAPRCGATVYQSDGSAANVQALHNAAHDGDTITLPAGTFSWTTTLNVTKGITLQGQTTISGTPDNFTVHDNTVILDDTPRGGQIISVTITPSQPFRLTGVTFRYGTTTVYNGSNGAFRFASTGNAPNYSVRIDHCHFDQLYQSKFIWIAGWTYGVPDHNLMDFREGDSFYFWKDQYGGPSQTDGNGAFADYPWFGTNKFFFVEDNRFNSGDPIHLSSISDADHGGRYVIRHNYYNGCAPYNHGAENVGPVNRGSRACEVYDNTFNQMVKFPAGERSGVSLWHDNSYIGMEQSDHHHTALQIFRESGAAQLVTPAFGIADGTSPWDKNATEPDGSWVEGHPPYLFQQGTATSSTTMGTLQDPTKNWATNQWVGYSVTNTTSSEACYLKGSWISANTSNAITYTVYGSTDRGTTVDF